MRLRDEQIYHLNLFNLKKRNFSCKDFLSLKPHSHLLINSMVFATIAGISMIAYMGAVTVIFLGFAVAMPFLK